MITVTQQTRRIVRTNDIPEGTTFLGKIQGSTGIHNGVWLQVWDAAHSGPVTVRLHPPAERGNHTMLKTCAEVHDYQVVDIELIVKEK